MSREALHESLSAVMDNEADELEIRRVLAGCSDAETRATWARYQLARAAMHKEPVFPKLDIASAVSAALADEEVPVAARKRTGWQAVGRLAVAASVTVAVLAGVRLYNQNEAVGPQMAQQAVQPAPASIAVPQTTQGPAMLAGYSEGKVAAPVEPAAQGGEGWHEKRLPEYVRKHAQQAAFGGGSEGALPYARAASMDENN
ncbi:RNA polymerase subunit sigma [Stutzerimonas urumqiensis]|uniref:sigma-E factor negative regulatory protein n=1 Tax=Stutzerimonas urumqiensis TaxID=638269 RepID=UPI000EB4E66D|nr:RseA family anti-sigma factor [Stutzerimonas urumqiensis]